MIKIGIDVSEDQGHIDWQAVKNDSQNITFVFIKATDGNMLDPCLQQNSRGTQVVNLTTGYYHFFRYHDDGIAQANFFWHAIKDLQPTELALDVELIHDLPPAPLSLAQNLQNCLNQLSRLAGATKLLIYTNANFWDAHIPANYAEYFKQFDLWIANYTQAAQPTLPKNWQTWQYWQYSDKGNIAGIKGMVDLNRRNL